LLFPSGVINIDSNLALISFKIKSTFRTKQQTSAHKGMISSYNNPISISKNTKWSYIISLGNFVILSE